jgi:Tol biopolymer transport system component
MDADGGNQTRVTNNNGLEEQAAAWSPDGARIAFAAWQNGYYQVFVINADGTNQTQLTAGSYNNDFPTWSPNGSRIMFGTNRDGNYELYVMNSDGTNPLRLTNNAAGDFQPNWYKADSR